MANDLEKIKMVYDYAKFHIGLYTGVVAASIAIGKIDERTPDSILFKTIAILGISCIVAAGACGAMVAVSIPGKLDLKYDDFKLQKLTAMRVISKRVEEWLFWEHKFFWVGLTLILATSLYGFIS